MAIEIWNGIEHNLGFGYMRLPMTDGKFDYESVNEMVDAFMAHGYYYFDTAYTYEGSEEALRKSLVERYPRDRFWITTKCNLIDMKDPSGMEDQLQTSLKRLGTDYIDCYFLHGLGGPLVKKASDYGAWDWLRSVRARGLAKHIGFSFHGTPEQLEEILSREAEIEVVQLQINYLDWDSEEVKAHQLYDIAHAHGKWITIMEPSKGGLLTSETSPYGEYLKSRNPDVSVASWAFRFCAGLDGILAILSGMCNVEQIEDNAKTLGGYVPLSEAERADIAKAVEMIHAIPRVPCTACRYCTKNCPKQLPIPHFMRIYNELIQYKAEESSRYVYTMSTPEDKRASNCVGCKSCEQHCPQHIEITKVLAELAERLEDKKE